MAGEAPFIQLGEDASSAPRLNYSIPEATSHVGTSVISVEVDEAVLNRETVEAIRANLDKKKPKRVKPIQPNLRVEGLKLINASDRVATVANLSAAAQIYEQHPSEFIYSPNEGMLGFAGDFDIVSPKPRPDRILPKILFFEKIQISTFLGNYGAGRVIKTFSLFPGEKTKISMKTYQKTVLKEGTKVNVGSSILDSVTEEAAVDFEHSVQSESSSKYTESEADILNAKIHHKKSEGGGEAKVLWGLVEAGGRGASEETTEEHGEWGTRSAREEFTNNVSSALFKHSARASSKRDVEVNTSSEATSSSTSEESTEQVIERELENVNVSRTLNLVFRQMVQEFISVIHLTDVKIALYDESPGPYPQYSLYELDRFLDDYFVEDPSVRQSIKSSIIRELFYVFDYRDEPQPFLELATLEFPDHQVDGLDLTFPESIRYLRVNKSLKTRLDEHDFIEVQGVVLKKDVITMRTEGVVVDGFLGHGGDPESGLLDDYASGLQRETVRQLALGNDLQEAEAAKLALARSVVSEGDAERAELFRQVHCCCPDRHHHHGSAGEPTDPPTDDDA